MCVSFPDIDECADNNGGCSVDEDSTDRCNNIDAGYECVCATGYEHFVSEGYIGYVKLAEETGYGELDLMRYNRTCVRTY